MTVINCDMGEAFGLYKMGDDAGLMPLIDVANVACGFHASDFNHMRTTVQLAKKHGVKVGAHPSLPDLQGFGRREMKMAREELTNCIIYQVGALKGFLEAEGMTLNHIKPHGSLYGMAARMEEVAQAVCRRGGCLQGAADGHDQHLPREGLHRRAATSSSPSSMPISTIATTAASSSPASMRRRTRPMPRRCACAPSARAR